MSIKEAAEASGVSAKMIRHYESIGLITDIARTASGYRVYGPREVQTLRFIRGARELGFSIDQMRELLALWRERDRASADVKRLALEHIRSLERKAANLQAMIGTLRTLADTCHGDDRPDCPIIDGLAQFEPGNSTPVEHERFGPLGTDPVQRRPERRARRASRAREWPP